MIRVTPVDSHAPSPHTVLGWSVTDLVKVVKELSDRGVTTLRFTGLDL
ncbi:MAG: VOC family protein, partial [Actinobacteria bacterium]|nr:VOC family protein [Actinomycetota bacterium]